MEFFVGDEDFSSEKLGKTATELNLARDWHWEIDRETGDSSLQSTVAKIEQRWLAVSNGGGGATAMRCRQTIARKRVRRGSMGLRTQCQARSGAYGDAGAVRQHGGIELLRGEIWMAVLGHKATLLLD